MSKRCTFCGHRYLKSNDIRQKTEKILIDLIENKDVTEFYCGNMGGFDKLCSSLVDELKRKYKNIKLCWVSAYSARNMYRDENLMYDEIIIPNLETENFTEAVTMRNVWMIDNCDIVVCYNVNNYGGAWNTRQYAENTNIEIIKV